MTWNDARLKLNERCRNLNERCLKLTHTQEEVQEFALMIEEDYRSHFLVCVCINIYVHMHVCMCKYKLYALIIGAVVRVLCVCA